MIKKTKQSIGDRSIALHRKLGGKISVESKVAVTTADELSLYYTPGVGAVAAYVGKHKKEAAAFTMKKNTVAVVSDGSAVLGLGNIGPEGALPVMEGKAVLFKTFANVDAVPIVLATQDVDEIVETVTRIAPGFGGINLEDIAAPRCFEIEERLKKELDIPVMHDDQHGTAIVVLAGLINAFKVVKKDIHKSRIIVVGSGAAGTAIAKLLVRYKAGTVIVLDSRGAISKKRTDLTPQKKLLAKITNAKNEEGTLADVVVGADAIIGVSGPKSIAAAHIAKMADRSIVFALANPIPEIMPEEAKLAGAHIIATGRSDFPNQINNVLVFPGIFRGALDHRVKEITEEMKLRAAVSLAALIKKPTPASIIPSVFDLKAAKAVAKSIA